ncbi:MAG: MarR family winged helix-turn-helix transcriptional regulator [Xanthobacteraceae bacterium]|nr:MarR family winged helix-turn-helix transcriptional regulator [Xanthobacteraceae bacterium]
MKRNAIAKRPRRSADDFYILDEQIGFWLRVAMQRHRAIFASKMTHGVTPIQLAALAKLLEVGPCSQNHLGRLIYVDPATIKGVVDRLCKRGLLTNHTDPKDRRRRAVVLSDKGRQTARAITRIGTEITAKTLVPLSKAEQRMIIALLMKLVDVDRATGKPPPLGEAVDETFSPGS